MILIFFFCLFSCAASELYICSECQCELVKFTGSEFFDVFCSPTHSGKETLELSDVKEAPVIRSLVVVGYSRVLLNMSLVGTWEPGRSVSVYAVQELLVLRWAPSFDYNLVGVTVRFARDVPATHVGSVVLVNCSLPSVPTGALAFSRLDHKFVAISVKFGDIQTGGIALPIEGKESLFMLDSSKVEGQVSSEGATVRCRKAVVRGCTFLPWTASGFQVVALAEALVTDNLILQGRLYDFFDVFSPRVLLRENRFVRPGHLQAV